MNRRVPAAGILALFLAFPASIFAGPDDTPRKGIELSDMNREVEACTDFYDFANGAWRAENPIPASMSRWSRRWKAGEDAKEQLRDILEETAADRNAPKGSVEQLVGDYYAACMDQPARNAAGVAPLRPYFAEIDAMKTTADVGRMIGRFHALGIPVPFGVSGGSDNHNPNDVIAFVYASGLGLPDRDYYVKTEKRFVEAREKYREHVARMLELAGWTAARARAGAATVFDFEKKLAEASLDNVALRDPKATDHKTSFQALQKMTPAFDWSGLREGGGLSGGRRQRQRAEVHGRGQPPPGLPAGRRLEDLHDLAAHRHPRPLPLRPLRGGGLRVQGRIPSRREGNETALEALRRIDGPASRRGPRTEVRREVLPAGRQGAHAGARQEPPARDEGDHRGSRLDERRDQGEGPREALDVQSESRLPRPVEGLQPRLHRAVLVLGRRGRGARSSTSTTTARRSASRSTAAAGA